MNKFWTFYYRKKDGYHQIIESSDVSSMVFNQRVRENRVFETKQEAMAALASRHGIQSSGKSPGVK